jgi:putative ATP-dependent endonuclease of the OLD family
MHITELRIRNFRNFEKATFRFQKGVNTLIGENASGKTNALHALRILLDESLERNAIYLRESDFCRDLGSWKGHWIILSVRFAELDPSEGCQLLRHSAAHINQTNTGTCTFFFRPKREVRSRLHDLSRKQSGVHEYVDTLTEDHYEPVLTGRATANFLDDQTYQRWIGDPAAGLFPDPEKDDLDALGVKIQPIYQEVACTFVRALRDVVAELRGYRGNPLLSLLRGMESEIKIADADRIANAVKNLNDDISTLQEIKSLAAGIEGALQKAVGHTYGPAVSIESALPHKMEKLLQRLSVLVGDNSSSAYRGELQEQSLGAANLIYLALKLLEYELKLVTDRVVHFFLIEEPEAHIHTHVQKTLFSRLPSERTQVIVTTHSTHISSAARIASVNILAKRGDHAEVYQPAEGLEKEDIARLERYLDAVRSTLLFAKGVVLVEGDAEQIMIPALLRAVFGVSPDELGFSVIAMSSAFFDHVAVIFADRRIRRPCAIVTDLDQSLVDLPTDALEDTTEQEHARAAEETGTQRKAHLDTVTSNNPWINVSFATHTFEAAFIASHNAYEVGKLLPSIYTRSSDRNKSKLLLDSDDPRIAGREVLRLANKIGKGWFALLLAEHLDTRTYIPHYILKAVAFACHQSISDITLKTIGQFRIGEQGEDGDLAKSLPADISEMSPAEFLVEYQAVAPDDDLTLFSKYIRDFQAT